MAARRMRAARCRPASDGIGSSQTLSSRCRPFEQGLAPRGIDRAHSPQVLREVSVADERREHRLRDRIAVRIRALLDGDQGVARPAGVDDEALAQRWEQALGEGSDVEDERVAVERLQRIERASAEAELAIVVVFDHDSVAAIGEVEQRRAPPQRKRDAGGRLVRWRDADDARSRQAGDRRTGPRRRRAPASSLAPAAAKAARKGG